MTMLLIIALALTWAGLTISACLEGRARRRDDTRRIATDSPVSASITERR